MAHPVRCLLCREIIEARELPSHVCRMRSGTDAEPECWPDGGVVVYEDPELMEA